jgi:hypothetical protein
LAREQSRAASPWRKARVHCDAARAFEALSKLENFRSVDRWVPAFAGTIIHIAGIGLQTLPAGDSEVGANGFRHTLSLDAAQTEISKAIVDRFRLLSVRRTVFASRNECCEFRLRWRLSGSRPPLPKLRGDARRRRGAGCKARSETEHRYRKIPHQALP